MNWRLVVSKLLGLSFLVCFVSGLMRSMDIHKVSAFVALVLMVVHVFRYYSVVRSKF